MSENIFQWAVLGAGPAGIAAIGKLLDNGIKPSSILWLDPQFKVGDLGHLWQQVSSNTTVKLFIDFLQSAASFSYQKAPVDFQLNHLDPKSTCLLSTVVLPLQWVSDHLRQQVIAEKAMIETITLSQQRWSLQSKSKTYLAKNVILATGAIPESLHYPTIDTVAFDVAIDKERLSQYINPNETYAVFGSSHSAIIIINNLVDLGVKKIINFYRSPCRYAINMGDWILFDNTGLKGHTAVWARKYIDGILPDNLVRYNSTKPNVERFLPECNKAIYAVGFKRRETVVIEGYEYSHYDPHVGIIGPGLFGFGIAYPEIKADPLGCLESQVGLWKFMVYLNKVLPLWFKYHA